jgi:predicted dehydrogenase/threonine dehydrogenase-like Zn-dependent dehydrogenase
MKQLAQNYKTGDLTLVEAPVPRCAPGGVLVRTEYSLISTGTEMMKVGEAKLSLLGKARARPDQVRNVLESLAQQGPQATYKKVMNRLDASTPLGYSLCGRVTEVGDGVTGFAVGQRVACAGNQYATHAEVNWVPVNLCAAVPEHVLPTHAAFTTVGAIALQGLRQAEMRLGEVACVVGLGLIGQLLVQLLDASGIRVVGVDPVPERCELAIASGAAFACSPGRENVDALIAAVRDLTGGFGADAVLLSASGDSNSAIELAAEVARDRGRVVDIGKCSLDLPWNAFYEKELDVRFSRSYGPGRYDPNYEERGTDYPIGYVRWTEGRHLACFLDLVARGRVRIEPIISAVVPFDQAVSTYQRLRSGELAGVGLLFQYPLDGAISRKVSLATAAVRTVPASGRLGIGFIGAGAYASTMLLPHLTGRDDVELVHVATATSLSCITAQRRFGFHHAGTDYEELLADPDIDAVFVVTRHHSHAAITAEALRAGKAVFVEKPLAITQDQLDSVVAAIEETGNDRLQVGFNRRFSPMLCSLKDRFGRASGPLLARYLVNAGTLQRSSWYADAELEGSRFAGEGGHFIDTLAWWFESIPASVHATPYGQGQDVQVTVGFDDGSVGSITYTTVGNSRFPRETIEVIADGKVARLDNFRSTSLWAGRRRRRWRSRASVDKGQRGELDAFIVSLRAGLPMPIPLPTLAAVTDATLAVAESLAGGEAVKLAAR